MNLKTVPAVDVPAAPKVEVPVSLLALVAIQQGLSDEDVSEYLDWEIKRRRKGR